MTDIDRYTKWFDEYAASFLKTLRFRIDEFNLKIKHTYEVVSLGKMIAASLLLDPATYRALVLSLLFHDVGRFKQYHDYGTFKDNVSVNHGELAKQILVEEGVLSDESPAVERIVLNAVCYHNAKNIPEHLEGDDLTVLKIVRDADKIDIFRVVTEQYNMEKKSRTVMLDLKDGQGVTQSVFDSIISKELVSYFDLVTTDDFKALQLGWIYDLNYKKSLELLSEKHYHTVVYNSMMKDEKADIIYNEVVLYLKKMIG